MGSSRSATWLAQYDDGARRARRAAPRKPLDIIIGISYRERGRARVH